MGPCECVSRVLSAAPRLSLDPDRRQLGADPARRLLRPDLAGRPRGVRGRARHRPGAGRRTGADAVFVGARFRPGAGGAALGLPLSELRDLRVDLADLDRALAERLPADLEPREALRRVAEIAVAAPPADAAIAEAARRLQQPQARVESLAGDLGLSERQLRRRCHAAAGYGPKTLQRVLRFRRFLAARNPDLARAALDAGYADQSHLTRECTRLAGRPPAALLRG